MCLLAFSLRVKINNKQTKKTPNRLISPVAYSCLQATGGFQETIQPLPNTEFNAKFLY